MKMLKHCVTWILASVLSGGAAVAFAAYPERPIRLIIPYAPGSAGDTIFRQVQHLLEKSLGQPIVFDYRSGAGGNIGTQEVVRAAPDGYTLLLGATNNFVINQFLYKKLAFDPVTDLVPITKVADVPAVVFVNGTLPVKNFQDLVQYAKSHPGKLNYGSPGPGTTPHLSAYMLSEAAQMKMTHVPYRGSAPGVQALLANEIQVYLGGYSIASAHLDSGKLKALVVADKQRLKALPDVLTTAEAGMPDVVRGNWWGLAAPKGTDPAIVAFLASEVQKVLNVPEIQQRYSTMGFVAAGNSPAEFSAQLKSEAAQWKRIVEKSGATSDN